MTRATNSCVARLLTLVFAVIFLTGCMGKRTRLMDERSALFRERDQMREPWQPHKKSDLAKNKPDEPTDPAERTQKIEQRVAEIDAELLQIK